MTEVSPGDIYAPEGHVAWGKQIRDKIYISLRDKSHKLLSRGGLWDKEGIEIPPLYPIRH